MGATAATAFAPRGVAIRVHRELVARGAVSAAPRVTLRPVHLPDGEPRFGPWRVRRIDDVLGDVLDGVTARPPLLAVDGRSGSGKTTVAERIAARVPGAAVVHTDDVAWYHAMFDWADLMADGVLTPLCRGDAVAFRPPPWAARGRPGAVTVPAGCPLVVVEGVGIGRRDLSRFFDALVWVQADRTLAWKRGVARDGGSPDHEAFWHEWEAEERPFLAAERPWERADVVVDGAPTLAHDPAVELLVATPHPRRHRRGVDLSP